MAIDSQRVGAMAMEFMSSLEQRFGEDATLETVGFLAAVKVGPGQSAISWHFANADGSGAALHVGRGMLAEADRGFVAQFGG